MPIYTVFMKEIFILNVVEFPWWSLIPNFPHLSLLKYWDPFDFSFMLN